MQVAERWSVELRGADLDRLQRLAARREQLDADAFGALGHTPGLVAEAVAIGLAVLDAGGGNLQPTVEALDVAARLLDGRPVEQLGELGGVGAARAAIARTFGARVRHVVELLAGAHWRRE